MNTLRNVTFRDEDYAKCNLVAVYGSLRKGMGNHGVLNGTDFVSTERKELPFDMISLGAYPALLPKEGESLITFELYRMNDVVQLHSLDALEGYNGGSGRYNLYERRIIELEGMEPFWIYYMDDREGYSQGYVDEGDWVKYRTNGNSN